MKYIGERYIPICSGEWTKEKPYTPLEIVSYEGDSYISKTYVPVGIDIKNNKFWQLSSKFSAQIESFRNEVNHFIDTATDELKLVQSIKVANIKNFGGIGDGVHDDTHALLGAINYAKENKLIVYIPHGIYKITQQVHVPRGITISGDCGAYPKYNTDHWENNFNGSTIAVYYGANRGLTDGAFLLDGYTTLDGLNFYYPELLPIDNPIPYSPCIQLIPDVNEYNNRNLHTTIKNCNIVNPYLGIDVSIPHECLTIQNVNFYAWSIGIKIDGSTDVDRIINVHSNPNLIFMGEWAENNLVKWQRNASNNFSCGLLIGANDALKIDNYFSYGFAYGIYISNTANGQPNGITITNSGIEGCAVCIYTVGQIRRLTVINSQFGATDNCGSKEVNVFSINQNSVDYEAEVMISNCNIWKSLESAIVFQNVKGAIIENCHINGIGSDTTKSSGVIKFNNSQNVKVSNCIMQVDSANPQVEYVRLINACCIDLIGNTYAYALGTSPSFYLEGSSKYVRFLNSTLVTTQNRNLYVASGISSSSYSSDLSSCFKM